MFYKVKVKKKKKMGEIKVKKKVYNRNICF